MRGRTPALTRTRTDEKALAALVLGLVSLAGCLGPLAGVPAMMLGALARRDIDGAEGRLEGRALATSGIVMGFLGTGFGVVLFLFVLRAALTTTDTTTAEMKRATPIASVDESGLSASETHGRHERQELLHEAKPR